MAKKRFYEADLKSSSGMISADTSANANLPQNVIMKKFPDAPYGLSSDIDDTISGVDAQMVGNNPKSNGSLKPSKY